MAEDILPQRQQLAELKRAPADLVDQIRMSRELIELSHELMKRSDELLAQVIIGDVGARLNF
jgi:hypothetical protein